MKRPVKILFLIVLVGALLQSCYTMLYPPKTLPETVTTVISEPVYVSSVGGGGMYGWDPYWEPVLPYTNYYSGYGRSYYNPYNYYDYHHSYYRPVYVKAEEPRQVPGREYGRDDKDAGQRQRTVKPGPLGNTGLSSSPPTQAPILTQPVSQPTTRAKLKEVTSSSSSSQSQPTVKQKRVRSSRSSKSSEKKTETTTKNSRSRKKK
ncbi:MAG: hypothetical protein K9M49_07860 [Candidatus Marinimicrobia bacterium]|nr:hypothetical protein [Candidatus Neomarinimicrobiota bacterium]MCF7850469.1 hypothetical protein [Candidatus Neomarinimicrobiota bacterium]MCF7905055.1 hypothetical protein [Candidatus Neomarinimicrobiota bacterium]